MDVRRYVIYLRRRSHKVKSDLSACYLLLISYSHGYNQFTILIEITYKIYLHFGRWRGCGFCQT